MMKKMKDKGFIPAKRSRRTQAGAAVLDCAYGMDETPYDGLAALVIRENIAQVLDEAVRLCLEQA